MGAKAEYRSAVRSREAIRSAFVELLKTRDLNRITVTDIVKLADVNRSTFYAHFPDVYGVVEYIEDETMQKLMAILEQIDSSQFLANPVPLLQQAGRQLDEEREYYRILIRASGAAGFLEKLQTAFAERMATDTAIPSSLRTNPAYILRVNYFAGGIVNLYRLWFAGELDYTMDEIANEVGKMIISASEDMR